MRSQIASRGIAYAGYVMCILGCVLPIAGLNLSGGVSFWTDAAVLSISLFVIFVGLVIVEVSFERMRRLWLWLAFAGMLGFAAAFIYAVLMRLNELGAA